LIHSLTQPFIFIIIHLSWLLQGQNVLAEKLRQYGTDQVEGSESHRLRKAKSWYGGMESIQNDYNPVNENEDIAEEDELYGIETTHAER